MVHKLAGYRFWGSVMILKRKIENFWINLILQVKAVREVMNQMLEAWKHIPDISDEEAPPNNSMSSSKG